MSPSSVNVRMPPKCGCGPSAWPDHCLSTPIAAPPSAAIRRRRVSGGTIVVILAEYSRAGHADDTRLCAQPCPMPRRVVKDLRRSRVLLRASRRSTSVGGQMAQGTQHRRATSRPFEVVFPVDAHRSDARQRVGSTRGTGPRVHQGTRCRNLARQRRKGRTRRPYARRCCPAPYEFRSLAMTSSRSSRPTPWLTVPSHARIYALSRVRVASDGVHRAAPGARPSGRYVEFMKGVHRRTGAPLALTFDQAGRQIDGEALIARLARARAKRLGKRDEALYDRPPAEGRTRDTGGHLAAMRRGARPRSQASPRSPARVAVDSTTPRRGRGNDTRLHR